MPKYLEILTAPLCILFVFLLVSEAPAEAPPGDTVLIQGGEFTMGDDYCAVEQGDSDWCRDEVPHSVRLEPYWIDKFEVTNEEYNRCFAQGACSPPARHEDRPKDFADPRQPAVFVDWKEASRFCQWRGGRLPTEAQWEFAARGKDLGGAHYEQPYKQGAPREVGQLPPNSHGLYDMMGNVYEWTRDWYGPYETEGVRVNPEGPKEGDGKVVRGGSWNSPAHYLRPTDRVSRDPELRYSDVGFRCVYPADENVEKDKS